MIMTDMTEDQKDLHAALMSDLEHYGCELDQARCNFDDDPSPENGQRLTHIENLVYQIEASLQEL